ncbi:MAG TPA: hypothetical protein VFS39_12575 [Nitrospira sp.]|nr:hypothetical protein [Nitrospira sp.]
MKAPAQKIPCTPYLVPRLFSAGTLWRAGLRSQPARFGKGVDSWLVFGLLRMGSRRAGHDK